jgi:hypothetical protein
MHLPPPSPPTNQSRETGSKSLAFYCIQNENTDNIYFHLHRPRQDTSMEYSDLRYSSLAFILICCRYRLTIPIVAAGYLECYSCLVFGICLVRILFERWLQWLTFHSFLSVSRTKCWKQATVDSIYILQNSGVAIILPFHAICYI